MSNPSHPSFNHTNSANHESSHHAIFSNPLSHPPSLIPPNISLRTQFCNTLRLWSSLSTKYQGQRLSHSRMFWCLYLAISRNCSHEQH
jgi:hypothetical protein